MSWNPALTPGCPDAIGIDAIETLIVPRARDLGDFEVRRALPAPKRQMVGPFIFFDQAGPAEFLTGQGVDVRPHPHIGLGTVTYLYRGDFQHRDSLGTNQIIQPGALNWMVAGRGVTHSERTSAQARSGPSSLFGIQTWVALPEAHEDMAPMFEHHGKGELPEIESEGISLRLILGTAYGAKAPATLFSETFYADVVLMPGARLPLPDEHEDRRPGFRRLADDGVPAGRQEALGLVYRDLVEVHRAQAGQLRILVREELALQQRIVRDVDARGMLVGRKAACSVSAKKLSGLRLRTSLPTIRSGTSSSGMSFVASRMSKGSASAFGSGDFHRLVPCGRLRAELWTPMELDEGRFILVVQETEGVDAEPLDHAQRPRYRPIGHGPHDHVGGFGHQADEIPKSVVRARRVRVAAVGLHLHRMDQVGELDRILDEEDRDVVADEVPVSFLGIELDGKAAHVARGVDRAGSARDGRKAHEHFGLRLDLGQDLGTAIAG